MESGIQLMFDLSEVTMFPELIAGASALPAKTFPSQGTEKASGGDRSSLVREVFRVLGELEESDRPEWLIYENVKGMLSSNRGLDFAAIILEMEQLGYDIEWELFNSKNFGVPQSRERVYTVGHLRNRGRRQIFPLRGADEENSVREVEILAHHKSYRRNTQVFSPDGITEALSTCQGGGREHYTIGAAFGIDYNPNGQGRPIANAIVARYYKGMAQHKQSGTAVAIPVSGLDRPKKNQNGRRFKENGEPSFTLTAQDRHGVALKIREATLKGYAEATEGDSINLTMPESKTRRGRVGKECAQTLDCACNQGTIVRLNDNTTAYAVWYEKYNCYIAIRKLTPRECFRLQGWTDGYYDKAAFVNSDSQLYKQAGNGVTVDVVYEIGRAIGEKED